MQITTLLIEPTNLVILIIMQLAKQLAVCGTYVASNEDFIAIRS